MSITGSKTQPSTMANSQWRRYGEARRAELVKQDEKEGGTSFDLNEKVPIQRYFQLSERVLSQFRSLCNSDESLEDAYVMGNRLLEFLGNALPNHPEYMNRTVLSLKNKSQQDLRWIVHKMDEIAINIDERVLNDYFTHEYEPEPVDDDSAASTEDESDDQWSLPEKKEQRSDAPWVFDPFDLADDEKPSVTFTDTSESSPEFDVSFDPEPQFSLSEDTDLSSSFLKKIANEDVTFETDSEAVDSWAQDDTQSQLSRVSSGTAQTCDPARIALRELMNNAPRIHQKAMQNERQRWSQGPPPPPPPPPKSNSPEWARFDFATVRQRRLRERQRQSTNA